MSTSKRGFASMDPEKRRAIARKGGAAVPKEKRTFFLSAKLASEAGKVGGTQVPPEKRSFSRNSALAKAAGRKGGYASTTKKREQSS